MSGRDRVGACCIEVQQVMTRSPSSSAAVCTDDDDIPVLV